MFRDGSSSHHLQHITVHSASRVINHFLLQAGVVDEMALQFHRIHSDKQVRYSEDPVADRCPELHYFIPYYHIVFVVVSVADPMRNVS